MPDSIERVIDRTEETGVLAFWAFAGELVKMYAAGWIMKNTTSGNSEVLFDIADGIRRISGQLQDIRDDLTEIIRLLDALPGVIQGVINQELMNSALHEANGRLDNIAPYLNDWSTFETNAENIRDESEEMWVQMNSYLERSEWEEKGPCEALLTLSPHFSAFAKAYTYSNRVLAVKGGKSVDSAPTVWEHRASRTLDSMLSSFFEIYQSVYEEFVTATSRLVPNETVEDPKTGRTYYRLYEFEAATGFSPTAIVVPMELGADPGSEMRFKYWGEITDSETHLRITHAPLELNPNKLFRLVRPRFFGGEDPLPPAARVAYDEASGRFIDTQNKIQDWRNLDEVSGEIDTLTAMQLRTQGRPSDW